MILNPFNRRAALRIAGVSLLLAGLASPLAWYVARESAEETTVALAAEESRRLLQHFAAFDRADPARQPRSDFELGQPSQERAP